ncbi:hypothetical protein OO007_06510 [Cocleimonas sp. KMM 6892]|uniref:hypothetical protein n=1 Tax=unclassified Cocleimonas TaxID=2639732 RepID=UPI002DB75063|nr:MULTISPECIES: hypothetical protein [unclassified Cocleimonas]MEB8431874.1 hypothetical protein [Cocleimonas sp. KMM 6892]MEC4715040.1 hypothetical protein [Cocleimonas sp. KMM 6895]MEC4744146.1 hypothetical protein [Cocleimonas sp. KMM 6896]
MTSNNFYLDHTFNAELLEIGTELLDGQKGVLKRNKEEYIEHAKKWFEEKKKEIIGILCSKQEFIEEQSDLNIAVADLISSIVIGVAPITVAKLITKVGLDKLCNSEK